MAKYINASDIGKTNYCPLTYYYDFHSIREVSDAAKIRRLEGITAHDNLNDKVLFHQQNQSILVRFWRWFISLFK